MVPLDVHMAIPRPLILHPSRINLHEPHTSLHQSPSHQTLSCEMIAARIIDPITLQQISRLALQIQRLGSDRLHPIRQFETLDPSRQFSFARSLRQMTLIERRK